MHIDDTQGKALKPQFDRMLKLSSLPRRLTMLPRGAIDRMRTQRDMAGSLSLKKLVQNPKTFFSGSRLTIKDPIAFFSAEWIARTYDAPVIIMARHPAGVISSYLTLGWPPETPYIVDHHLPLSQGVLDADIAKYRKNPDDHLGGLILQWKLFTHYTMDLMQLHPDWKFFLHKHVCNSPMEAFTEMYAYAGLDMSERVRNFIGTNTRGNLVDPKSDHAQHMLTRNSASLPQAWKQRLDDDSARRILRETGELFEDLESRIAKGKRITWLSLSPQIAAE